MYRVTTIGADVRILHRPFFVLPLAAFALLAAVAAAPAGAAPLAKHEARSSTTLPLGVYDCMTLSRVTGFLDYMESVALLPGGRYQQAFGRHRTRMIKPTAGTYRIAGSRLIFRGGALAQNPGMIYSHGHVFALLLHGKPSGWACYHVAKP